MTVMPHVSPTSDTLPGNHQGDALRQRVRACVAESGLTQQEFAQLIGLDHTKLSKTLHGKRRFQPDELVRIATEVGVTANWLLTGSDGTAGATSVPSPRSLPTRLRDEAGTGFHTIVQTAWHQFARHGFDAVRLADIAASCQMSTSNVYSHFASKRELFEECLRYSVKLAFDRQVTSLDASGEPLTRLRHLVHLQLPATDLLRAEWSIWLQSWAAVAVGQASRKNQSEAYARWYRTMHAVLAEGQVAGQVVDIPVSELTTELTSLIDGLGIKVLVGALDADRMHSQIHRFIDRTIVRRAPDRPSTVTTDPDHAGAPHHRRSRP